MFLQKLDELYLSYDVIYAGLVGIKKSKLSENQLKRIRGNCKKVKKQFIETEEKVVVKSFRDTKNYIWVPRYFDHKLNLKAVPSVNLTMTGDPIDLEFNFELRDDRDQVNAYHAMVLHLSQYGAGILKAYTGFGKTFVSVKIASYFNCPIAVFVDQVNRIPQWVSELCEATNLTEKDIGIVQGSRCDLGKPITIISTHSIVFDEDASRYPELYSQMGFLIADECELFGAKKWSTTFSKFSAKYRLGMSATPYRKDGLDEIFKWELGGKNAIVYEARKGNNIERPDFYEIIIDTDPEIDGISDEMILNSGRPDFGEYCTKIARNKMINLTVSNWISKMMEEGRKTLVLCQRKGQPFQLEKFTYKAIEKNNLIDPFNRNIAVMSAGGDAEKKRKKALESPVTISTFHQLRRGYSDSNVDTLIFAGPPGADITQPLGRLRDFKTSDSDRKNLVAIWFSTNLNYDQKRSMMYEAQLRELDVNFRQIRVTPIRTVTELKRLVKARQSKFKNGVRLPE